MNDKIRMSLRKGGFSWPMLELGCFCILILAVSHAQ